MLLCCRDSAGIIEDVEDSMKLKEIEEDNVRNGNISSQIIPHMDIIFFLSRKNMITKDHLSTSSIKNISSKNINQPVLPPSNRINWILASSIDREDLLI